MTISAYTGIMTKNDLALSLTLLKGLFLGLGLIGPGVVAKAQNPTAKTAAATYEDIQTVGAMKEVMWKGALGSRIDLDTIGDKKGLYGLGPESYLAGELLIINGICYRSRVTSDSSMSVEATFDASAPFFVYGRVKAWQEIELPLEIKTIKDLEEFINQRTQAYKRPFAFRLTGEVARAHIHVQNLPEGTSVSSPEEAHRGQVNYTILNAAVDIVGFFSTEHQGIFTHHDTFMHMHLLTKDQQKMGHVDELQMGKMRLYLPKK